MFRALCCVHMCVKSICMPSHSLSLSVRISASGGSDRRLWRALSLIALQVFALVARLPVSIITINAALEAATPCSSCNETCSRLTRYPPPPSFLLIQPQSISWPAPFALCQAQTRQQPSGANHHTSHPTAFKRLQLAPHLPHSHSTPTPPLSLPVFLSPSATATDCPLRNELVSCCRCSTFSSNLKFCSFDSITPLGAVISESQEKKETRETNIDSKTHTIH